mgnify:CR=1 FL=1
MMKEKSRITKIQRIAALICALAIPVLYVITLILYAVGSPKAPVFLAIAFAGSFFLLPVMYLVLKFPKDMVETYFHMRDMAKNTDKANHKTGRK